MSKPAAPSWTIPQWATTTNYPAGPNPWNGQPTKVAYVSPTGGFVPRQGAAAQFINYEFNLAFATDQSAKDYALTLLDYVGQATALSFTQFAFSSATSITTPAYDAVTHRWVCIRNTGAAIDFLWSYDGSYWLTGASFTSFNMPEVVAVNPSGIVVAIDNALAARSLPVTSTTWSSYTVAGTAGTVFQAATWLPSANLFLAVGSSAGPIARGATSAGAANWVDVSTGFGSAAFATIRVAASPTLGVVFSNDANQTAYWTTTNGSTFTARVFPTLVSGESLMTMAFSSSDGWMAISRKADTTFRTWTSPDALTWTLKSATTSIRWAPRSLKAIGSVWMLLTGRDTSIDSQRETALYSTDYGATWRVSNVGMLLAASLIKPVIHIGTDRFMISNGTTQISFSTVALGQGPTIT